MKKALAVILLAFLSLAGCTQQERAKEFGGTAYVDLPKGKKLVTATWKNTDLWYLYREMQPNEKPEEYTFKESSTYGIMQGQVIFRESK